MWTQVEDQISGEYDEDSSSSMMPGASAVDQCLVPPGYVLPEDGSEMVECPTGAYKEVGGHCKLLCLDVALRLGVAYVYRRCARAGVIWCH
jgi:hypothetical protein